MLNLKQLLIISSIGAVLLACSQTPNNISLTFTPGICVTGALPGYEAEATSYSSAFPINAKMPESSPYCMAVTVSNNNSGHNANNIQIFQSGLSLSYSYGNVNFFNYLVDFNAAGIPSSTFGYGQVQQSGNIALFDPSNCVTPIGARVNTLNANGGACTFYLSLVGESAPIGSYPINLAINYTNGNNNYTARGSFYQKTKAYIGGEISSPESYLVLYNGTKFESLTASYPGESINYLQRDAFGNLYVFNTATAYLYRNGAWQTIGLPAGEPTVNAVTSDGLGYIYLATNNGVYAYSINYPTWQTLGLTGNNIAGVTSSYLNTTQSTLTVVDNSTNSIQSCSFTVGENNCSFSSLASAIHTNINNQSFVTNNPIYYYANASALYNYTNSAESLIAESGFTNSGNISQLALDNTGLIYSSFENIESNTPAVTIYNTLNSPNVLVSLNSNSGNSLNGYALGIYPLNILSRTTSASTMLLVYGANDFLLSNDFSGFTNLAYLTLSYNSTNLYTPSAKWQSITGISGTINAVSSTSFLSN